MPIINVRILVKMFVLNNDGKVLLLQRSATDDRRPLGWDLPGGNLEHNEDPNEAMLRELKEEAGLDASDSQVLWVASETDDHHIVTLFYKGSVLDDAVTLSHEHEQYMWVYPEEIAQIDIPPKYKKGAELLN